MKVDTKISHFISAREFELLIAQASAHLRADSNSTRLLSPARDPNQDLESALSAARECGRTELIQCVYEMALSLFAQAEATSERICMITPAPSARAAERSLQNAQAIAHALGTSNSPAAHALEIRRLRTLAGSLQSRSRRWAEIAVAMSAGKHLLSLELFAAHLVLEGQSTAAFCAYERIAQLAPSAKFRARSLSNRGKSLLDMGCFEAARESCESSIALMPDQPFAHANLAMSKFLLGDSHGSLTAYESAIGAASKSQSERASLRKLLAADLRWLNRFRPNTGRPTSTVKKVLKSLVLSIRNEKPASPLPAEDSL